MAIILPVCAVSRRHIPISWIANGRGPMTANGCWWKAWILCASISSSTGNCMSVFFGGLRSALYGGKRMSYSTAPYDVAFFWWQQAMYYLWQKPHERHYPYLAKRAASNALLSIRACAWTNGLRPNSVVRTLLIVVFLNKYCVSDLQGNLTDAQKCSLHKTYLVEGTLKQRKPQWAA